MSAGTESEKYEEAMQNIGGFGWFQKKLCILLTISTLPNGYFAMAIVFVAATPAHRCFIPEHDNYTVKATNKEQVNYTALSPIFGQSVDNFMFPDMNSYIPKVKIVDMERFSQCRMFQDKMINRSNSASYTNTTFVEVQHSISCLHGWVFDYEPERTSIVTEWLLVCERGWIAPLITAIYMGGVLVGSLASGIMSDFLGRKITFLIGTLLQFVCLALSGVSNGPAMFAASMFAAGAFAYINYVTAFIIAAEIINTKGRVITGVLTVGGFAGGYMLLPLFAYYLPNWRVLSLVLSSLGFIFIPYVWLMPESPRWLYSKKKFGEFKKLFKKIAIDNGIPPEKSDSILRKLLSDKVNKDESEEPLSHAEVNSPIQTSGTEGVYTCTDLVRTKSVCIRTVNMWIIWFVCAVVYYGLGLNTSNLGGNPYVNCFVAAAVEIPAYGLTILSLKYQGRKIVLVLALIISGICCTSVPYLQKKQNTLSIVIAMVGKFAISGAFSIIYIFCSELYPTLMRSMGVGASSMAARVGGMVAPYLLYIGKQYHAAPYLLMGLFSAVAVLMTVILPETKDAEMPETVAELSKISCPFPKCLRRSKKDNNGLPSYNDVMA